MSNASPAPLRRPAVRAGSRTDSEPGSRLANSQAMPGNPANAARVKPPSATTHDRFQPEPPPLVPGDEGQTLEPTLPVDIWRPSPAYPLDPHGTARRKVAQAQARIDRDLQGVRQAIEMRRQERPWSVLGDEVVRSLKRAEDALLDARGDARDALKALDRAGNWDSWNDWRDRDLDRARDHLDDMLRELGNAQRHLDEARQRRAGWDLDPGRDFDPRNPLDPVPYDRYGTDRLGRLLDTLRWDVATAAREARDARDDLGHDGAIPVDPWPRPMPPSPWPLPLPDRPDRPNPRPPRGGNPIQTDPWPRPGHGDRPTPPPIGAPDRPNPRPPRR